MEKLNTYSPSLQRGFTILEVLITVSVLAVLSTVGTLAFMQASRRAVLNSTANEIVAAIRLAQQRAMAQEEGVVWGVHFKYPPGGRGFYAIYKSAYSEANTTEKYFLPPQLIFGVPPGEGESGVSVQFALRSGEMSSPAHDQDIVIMLPEGPSRTIRIYRASGVASVL